MRKRIRKRILYAAFVPGFLVICFMTGVPDETVLALDSKKALSQYVHDSWGIEDGLPQSHVQAITQTRDGYLWLATQEGLVRFDGVRFAVFDKSTTDQIQANNIQALCEDHDGALWAGTEGGGVIRFKDGRFTAFTTADGLASNIVETIAEDRDGNLWVGTLGGVSKFETSRFVTYPARNESSNDSALAICQDNEATLWVGMAEGGLRQLRGDRLVTPQTAQGLRDGIVRALYQDREGRLWAGTRKGVTVKVNGTWLTYTTRDGLPSDNILTIYQDRQGNLWFGTEGGLARFDVAAGTVAGAANGRFISFTMHDGLSSNSIASLYEDREGSLWVGTYGGGLNRLKDGKFINYTKDQGLPHEIARAIYEDRDANLWMGSDAGLVRRSANGQLTTYTDKTGLPNNTVLSIIQDSLGAIWIGTDQGLSRFQNGKFTTYSTKDGLSDATILSLAEDPDGSLWVGTAAGLNQLKGSKFKTYTTADGLRDDSIGALLAGREGELWVGTSGGLHRYQNGAFKVYGPADGLANDVVMALYEDAEGDLWVGTLGGLSRLKDGQLTTCAKRHGLFDDAVFCILEDARNNLWMSCNKGVFRVNKQEFERFAGHEISSVVSVSYGVADGMRSRECNGGFQPAGWKSLDGRLWFPTTKGISVINPSELEINQQPPPVLIEEMKADGNSLDLSGDLRLPAGREKLEFRYTALSFLAPQQVRFKYKLEGFDADWVDAGTRREISYTNIPPGDYRFRVVACNNDGVWNEAGAAVSFYLQPKFYQTYWFYGLCLLGLGALGWAGHRLRVRHVRAQFEAVLVERNRIARDIHDTLAQGFVGIALQLEAVKTKMAQSPEAALPHLDTAAAMVTHSLEEARRTVWDLRSRTAGDAGLVAALSDVSKQLTNGASTPVRIKVSGAPRNLPETVGDHLLRIGQEAVTNSLKHAAARQVEIELCYDPAGVILRVRDDGKGFDVNETSPSGYRHFGLIGMRERADQIGGTLIVRSKPGEGTEIEVTAQIR